MRPGVQALSFHALRWLGRAEALRQLLATRPPPPEADALLCVALALIWKGMLHFPVPQAMLIRSTRFTDGGS